MKQHYFILALILFLTFLFRFPSLFEPFWYGDEGIFAAVARNLNFGGVLYQDAWDNKPPMIYWTYQLIFKVFGVSMFWLRLVTVIVVLATTATIYEIAQKVLGSPRSPRGEAGGEAGAKRALIAAFIFGLLSSLRVIEGNLALTEIFMILPITLAMLITLKHNFDYISLFCAGALFAIASLYKQVGALEVVALGIFLLLISKNKALFIKRGLVLTAGFVIPSVLTLLYFAPKGLVDDYIFAAYTYYQIYLGESPRYAVLINILKFLPIAAVIGYGLWKKYAIDHWGNSSTPGVKVAHTPGVPHAGNVDVFHLFLLWAGFSFLGSYFSGRTYGHYLVQAAPAVSLLLASINIPSRLTKVRIIFALFFFIPLFVLIKLLFSDFFTRAHVNQISWWRNFIEYSTGGKSVDDYNNYFDANVNSIMTLADFFATTGAGGAGAYIWGEYPWLYAISDLSNPSRYVTSFHVFGVPNGVEEVAFDLTQRAPSYIIKPPSSIGYFEQLEKLLATNYTLRFKIGNSDVFVKKE